ncbi:MAG: S41 family peptidase [Flavitalea sp.]
MKKLQVWLPLLFAIVMIVGMQIGYKLRENIPVSQGFFSGTKRSSLQEVVDLVDRRYVDPIDTDTLTDDAVQAMLTHLDPHSIFIPARNLAEVNEDLQGNFEGIGVEFLIIEDTVNVTNVSIGGPSEKAGLKVGDKFIKVSDSVVAGVKINSDKIKKLLRGERGSEVKVSILRGGKPVTASITRGTIPLYSVDAAYMLDPTTGLIHVGRFAGTTYKEFMYSLEQLQKKGLKSLILDLRGNGGGILQEAVNMADEFLDGDKLIVYTQGEKQPRLDFNSKRPGLLEEGKLVILVDEGSASASEVLAGAVQDWDRGTIIGRRTFGKGLVQEQYNLSNGAALRLTVARYYTPTGRSIQKPYTGGRAAYMDEITERFHNGEVIHADTIKAVMGKAFKTKGGRTVYGGGGITPDIFVPFDTTSFTPTLGALFYDGRFTRFIYNYYIDRKDYFDQFKSPSEFAAGFKDSADAWNRLVAFMDKNKVTIGNVTERDKAEIRKRIKTWMARQIWRMQGYYEVNNQYDQAVTRAITEVKSGTPLVPEKK